MSKKQIKILLKVLYFFTGVLISCALIDLCLWFIISYVVPSFTISFLTLGFAVLLLIICSEIKKEYDSRGIELL